MPKRTGVPRVPRTDGRTDGRANGRPRIFTWQLPVAFTSVQEEHIIQMAEDEGIPYAEAVRRLVDAGIDQMSSLPSYSATK